jgi:Domain of unknown function (DUF4337)
MKPTRVNIPNELKSDLPPTMFGKILGATPVVMAVVATMLAGLASSEMTKAQYSRSYGAQLQSKAGDQWSFFQAKRMRSAIQQNTSELLQSVLEVRPMDAATFVQQVEAGVNAEVSQKIGALAQSQIGQKAIGLLAKGEVPSYAKPAEMDPAIKAAMEGIENSVPDEEMSALLAKVDGKALNNAMKNAQEETKLFDAATKPVNQAVDQLNSLLEQGAALARQAGNTVGALRSFTSARLRYTANRYEVEARLNQTIANLYEIQVRKANVDAEHHQKRSQRFFFGMLAAQAGVIISTFAMAARNRNLLWSLAAGAGLVAVAFAIYVYLYI